MSRPPSRSARTGGRSRRSPRSTGRSCCVAAAPKGSRCAAGRPPPPCSPRRGRLARGRPRGWTIATPGWCRGTRRPGWDTEGGWSRGPEAGAVGGRGRGPRPAASVGLHGLLGTGATGPARGDVLALAQRLVTYRAPIVAVDGPTGLDLSSGEAHGPVRAALSITFGGARRGHLVAREWCGKLIVVDIGFPPPDPAWPVLVSDLWAGARLPRLAPTMHKGDRGRVTVVGGSNGMTGAALHAARAALAAGAGLVKLVAAQETITAARASLPDVLTVESALGPELEPDAADALEWADALVVGPGRGRQPRRAAFLQAVLGRRPVPTVLDADALALFHGSAPERPVVLTPPLGAFRAQFGDQLADEAANDRWAAAAKAAQRVKGTVV